MQCVFSLPSKCDSFFFRQHKSYHHLLYFFVMSRVVEGVTSEQPLLCFLELGLDLPWPFVTSIPWKSPSDTLRPDGETHLHSTAPSELPLLIQLDIFHPHCQGFYGFSQFGMRWAAESPSWREGWWEMLLHPLPKVWKLNRNYPAIIHSSLGKVVEKPFISMRIL